MYCEYVIRNNAKSRIQNKWKGPLRVSSCKTFDTLYVTKTLDDNAFLYKYLMSFERGILI